MSQPGYNAEATGADSLAERPASPANQHWTHPHRGAWDPTPALGTARLAPHFQKNHNLVRRFDCIAWEVPDTIATIIVLITPVLVWAIPNKKLA